MYQRLTTIFIICLTLSISSFGQNGIQNLGGAISQGLGGAGIALDNITAQYTNQAGTAFLKDWAIDVSVDRRFNIQELTTFSTAISYPMSIGSVGVTVAQYGFEEYAEQKLGLSYARKLNQKIALSAQFDLIGFKIEGFGNSYKPTAEFGIYAKANKKLHIAAHVFNPGQIALTENENLDSRLGLAARYLPSPKLDLFLEFEKIIDREPQVKFATAYRYQDYLELMLGANLNVESLHFGFKYNYKNQLGIAVSFSLNNNQIGNSTAFTGQYYHQNTNK